MNPRCFGVDKWRLTLDVVSVICDRAPLFLFQLGQNCRLWCTNDAAVDKLNPNDQYVDGTQLNGSTTIGLYSPGIMLINFYFGLSTARWKGADEVTKLSRRRKINSLIIMWCPNESSRILFLKCLLVMYAFEVVILWYVHVSLILYHEIFRKWFSLVNAHLFFYFFKAQAPISGTNIRMGILHTQIWRSQMLSSGKIVGSLYKYLIPVRPELTA